MKSAADWAAEFDTSATALELEQLEQQIRMIQDDAIRWASGRILEMVMDSLDKNVSEIYASRPVNSHNGTTGTEQLIRMVASYFGISEQQMMGHQRSRNVTWPRFCAMHLMHRYGMTAMGIGNVFGFTHGSVLHGLDTVKIEYQLNKRLCLHVQQLEALAKKQFGDFGAGGVIPCAKAAA
jgi:chromosomal replication initiation ATPase DnaA